MAVSYTNDPLLPAWYIPGWSSQSASYPLNIPGVDVDTQNPWPTALLSVNVAGHFFQDDMNPQGGYVTFQPSVRNLQVKVSSSPDKYVVISSQFQKSYLTNGVLNFPLLATDNTGVLPNIFSYHVKEHWLGGKEYDIVVPKASPDLVDIHTLIVPEPLGVEVVDSEDEKEIEFFPGDSYDFTALYEDGANNPIDITGYTGSLVFRDRNGTTLLSKSATVGGGNGLFFVHVSDTETAALQTDSVVSYYLKIASASGDDIKTLLSGPVGLKRVFGG